MLISLSSIAGGKRGGQRRAAARRILPQDGERLELSGSGTKGKAKNENFKDALPFTFSKVYGLPTGTIFAGQMNTLLPGAVSFSAPPFYIYAFVSRVSKRQYR